MLRAHSTRLLACARTIRTSFRYNCITHNTYVPQRQESVGTQTGAKRKVIEEAAPESAKRKKALSLPNTTLPTETSTGAKQPIEEDHAFVNDHRIIKWFRLNDGRILKLVRFKLAIQDRLSRDDTDLRSASVSPAVTLPGKSVTSGNIIACIPPVQAAPTDVQEIPPNARGAGRESIARQILEEEAQVAAVCIFDTLYIATHYSILAGGIFHSEIIP